MNPIMVKYSCATCGCEFIAPGVDEFAYGEFILWTPSGDEGVYFEAIGSVEFDELDAIAVKIGISDKSRPDIVQHMLGDVVMDPSPKGERYSMFRCPRCPRCGSTARHGWSEVTPAPPARIGSATFDEWNKLPYMDKVSAVKAAYDFHNESR